MKDVLVMADFSSSGLWILTERHIAAGGMIDYEDLSISKALEKEFESWIYAYEGLWYNNYSSLKLDRLDKFNFWGRTLAIKLFEEIPEINVWYLPQKDLISREKYHTTIITDKYNTVLAVSDFEEIEIIDKEVKRYGPILGKLPHIGDKFFPVEDPDNPSYLK